MWQVSCNEDVSSSVVGNYAQVDTTLEQDIGGTTESVNSPLISMGNECFFCEKKTRKFRGKILALHISEKKFRKSVLENLKTDTDYYSKIDDKLRNIDGDKVYYHHSCRCDFRNKQTKSNRNPESTSWHTSRETHQITFEEIQAMIEDFVISKRRIFFHIYISSI